MAFDERLSSSAAAPATYSFGEDREQSAEQPAMAVVALSHTIVEHRLYSVMLSEISSVGTCVAAFTTRRLMNLSGINAYSTVRRALAGLMNKLSIERQKIAGDNGRRHPSMVYLVFSPEEILARRRAVGLSTYPKGVEIEHSGPSLAPAIRRIVDLRSLSRREAQVTLCCVQGLTNAEIGARLQVSEQTVKFHLRNIFVKCGVKRRAELVSRLLRGDRSADFGL